MPILCTIHPRMCTIHPRLCIYRELVYNEMLYIYIECISPEEGVYTFPIVVYIQTVRRVMRISTHKSGIYTMDPPVYLQCMHYLTKALCICRLVASFYYFFLKSGCNTRYSNTRALFGGGAVRGGEGGCRSIRHGLNNRAHICRGERAGRACCGVNCGGYTVDPL